MTGHHIAAVVLGIFGVVYAVATGRYLWQTKQELDAIERDMKARRR